MNTQKVAISIPRDLVACVDDFSRQMGISRSRYITLVLEERIARERQRRLKEAYDTVFEDEAVLHEQLETANWFDGTGEPEGQEW